MHRSMVASVLSLVPLLSRAIPPPNNAAIWPLQPTTNNASTFEDAPKPSNDQFSFGITYNFHDKEQGWPSRNVEAFISSAIRRIPSQYLHEPFHRVEALNTQAKMHFDMTVVSNPPISFSNIDAKNALNRVRQHIIEIGWSSSPKVKPFNFNVWGTQQGGRRVQVVRGNLRAIQIGGSGAFPLQLPGSNSTTVGKAHDSSNNQERFEIKYTPKDQDGTLSVIDLDRAVTSAWYKIPQSRAPFHQIGAATDKVNFNIIAVSQPPIDFTDWDAKLVVQRLRVHILSSHSGDMRMKTFTFGVYGKFGAWPQRPIRVASGMLSAIHPGS